MLSRALKSRVLAPSPRHSSVGMLETRLATSIGPLVIVPVNRLSLLLRYEAP